MKVLTLDLHRMSNFGKDCFGNSFEPIKMMINL